MKKSIRKRLAVVAAGLIVVGAGGVATQAGFTDNATIEASAKAGTVVVDGPATSVDFGQNLGAGAQPEQSIEIQYAGTLAATTELTLENIQVTDTAGDTAEYTLEYATDSGFTQGKGQVTLKAGTSTVGLTAANSQMSWAEDSPGQTKTLYLRLTVPNDARAQNDAVSFDVKAVSTQS